MNEQLKDLLSFIRKMKLDAGHKALFIEWEDAKAEIIAKQTYAFLREAENKCEKLLQERINLSEL